MVIYLFTFERLDVYFYYAFEFYQQLKWFLKGVVIESIAVTILFFKTLLVHLIFEIEGSVILLPSSWNLLKYAFHR